MDDVIAAGLIAGLAALGGSGLTYLVTNRAIKAQVAEGQRSRDYDRDARAQDRAFERHADACLGVDNAVTWMQDYVIYWTEQVELRGPDAEGLIKLTIPGHEEFDKPPTPPTTWADSMRGLASLYIDLPTQDKLNDVLEAFTRFQSILAVILSGEPVPGSRETLVKQLHSQREQFHTHAGDVRVMLREEVERLTK